MAQFNTVLRMKSWEAPVSVTPAQPRSTGGGIGGFMRNMEAATQARGEAVHTAFGDLDALMGMAKQMVGLASRLKAPLAVALRRRP